MTDQGIIKAQQTLTWWKELTNTHSRLQSDYILTAVICLADSRDGIIKELFCCVCPSII